MANRYAAAGRTVATAATADNAACGIWNPDANKSIYVREMWVFTTTANAMNLGIQRVSTEGTVVVTVTPDADSAFDRRATPPSSANVNLDFSAEPTIQGPYMLRAISAALIGAGWIFGFPQAIEVPAGTGLYVFTTQAVAFPVSEFTVVWDE